MKKNKLKKTVKEQKKIAKKELGTQIATALNAVLVEFGESNKKIQKLIDKKSKQIAKKLSNKKKILTTKTETPEKVEN